ncbi:MAG: hypothetical protein BMS9Abin33_0125 [Gammaproteobacteria bacterium]|nr:MAG: hypothetical protein BMS9Abin33_0125 [Gammaproteobacteria bacterium]
MAITSNVDLGTLSWVKTEIDESLKQARQALESFAENQDDESHLRFCGTHLHQVVGTLEMVQLDGAAMLAKEIEALIQALLDENIKPDDSIFDYLTRGILTLPDYLSRLQVGQPDVPLRLLPLVNELRSARGEQALPEIEFFNPDLSIRPPRSESEKARLSDDEYRQMAKKLRPKFQTALLTWLRDTANTTSMDNMAKVLDQLRSEANLGVIQQLFWVASGLLDAMLSNDLEPTNERKKLFSRLDQQIKRLIDGAGKTDLRNSSEELVKNILFQLGGAKAENPKVAQLKQAFDLDLLLGSIASDTEVEDLPAPEVIDSVSSALSQEIGKAQDLLAGYFDPDQEDVSTLAPLVELLGKMARTMEMLGTPLLKTLADGLATVCSAIDSKELEETDAISMVMARALLLIENSSRDISRSASDWKQQVEDSISQLNGLVSPDVERVFGDDNIGMSEDGMTDSDFHQLLSVVADEVRQSLGTIEEEFEAYAGDASQTERLDVMLEYLGQVEGALQIIDQDNASMLVRRTGDYISEIKSGELTVNDTVLDALAVCIGTIGAYIDGLLYNRPNLDDLINMAIQEIEFAATGAESRPATPAIEPVEAPEDIVIEPVIEGASQDVDAVNEITEIAALVEAGEEEEVELAPPPSTEEPGSEDDDYDEEIMEIFIEDARDSIDTITRNLPIWRQDLNDSDAFLEIRRGFHTIKGSGRMVGASEIAELAWAYENLLNKVRDNNLPASDGIAAAVDEVMQIMPAMVDHLEGEPAVDADIEGLRTHAHDIADGKTGAGEFGGGTSPQSVAPVEATLAFGQQTPAASAGAEAITRDSTLLEIFTGETENHLVIIREHVASCQESGSCFASANLIRAAHTLSGSARSVGLYPMSDATKAMELLLQELDSRQILLTKVHIELLAETEESVAALVNELNTSNTCSRETVNRFNGLARNLKAIMAALDADEVSTETSRATVPPPAPPEVVPAPPVVAPRPRTPAAATTGPAADTSGDLTLEDIDPDLAEIFYEEAVDILQIINDAQVHWRADLSNTGMIDDLKRALHTLKGGARMAGAMSLGDVAHNTETLVGDVENGKILPSIELIDLLDEIHDTLAAAIAQVSQGQPMEGIKMLAAKLDAFIAGKPMEEIAPPVSVPVSRAGTPASAQSTPGTRSATAEQVTSAAAPEVPQQSVEPSPVAAPMQPAALSDDQLISEQSLVEPGKGLDKGERREQIRVRTALLDQLVSYAGEVSISRSRMEQQVFGLRENLGDLQQNVTRFREQLRDLEIQSETQILYKTEQAEKAGESSLEDFDPLEFDRFTQLQQLSRSLTESLHDLSAIQNSLGNFASEAETVLIQQARVNTDLQEGLMRTRMVGFSTQATRLRHIVRQTGRELGKNAQLVIGGADVELDRTVLERMIGPFEHIIRNALDHGIESAEERRSSGKPATATIRIDPEQKGNEIVIRISDDGRGLNIPAIRNKAISQGLMSRDSNLSDEEVTQFILMAGFSTAESVSHISGRGVGMDVVHNEVRQLSGSISVETQQGQGTTFVISLPLTLSIMQALMIYVGEQMFAIPLASVVNILELPVEEIRKVNVGESPMLNYEDEVYPFMHLGARLEITSPPRTKKVAVLLVQSGPREVAMEVDGLGGTREIVIKSVGVQLAEIPGLGGATILGDGSVVLILDVPGLWLSDDTMHLSEAGTARSVSTAEPILAEEVEKETTRPPVVMIVDDSLTVRKITSRHLQKRGMEVLTAKDGIDAVEQLRDHIPDVMLVDIEMPRMDGYELTSRVRSESRLKHIPIIMITSRAGAKHKKKAMSLGVNLYMSKPYQEDDLVANIEEMLELKAQQSKD